MECASPSPRNPGPTDYEAKGHPFGRAWVRRVGGRNLWRWYRFTDEELVLVTVTTDPPVPFDESWLPQPGRHPLKPARFRARLNA